MAIVHVFADCAVRVPLWGGCAVCLFVIFYPASPAQCTFFSPRRTCHLPGLQQNQERTNSTQGLSASFAGGCTNLWGLLALTPPPLRKRSNRFAAKLIIRQKATVNVSKVVKISSSYLNSVMTQSFHMYATQVQRYMPACSRPCKLWRGSRPRRQDLTTHILGKLEHKPRPSIFPRKPRCTIPETERGDHIHVFWAMTGILDKALSNLVWPYSWLHFEQEVGLEASWGLFQPELWALGGN